LHTTRHNSKVAHEGLPSKDIKTTDDLTNRIPNARNVNKLAILLRTACPHNQKHDHSSIAEHDCKQQNDYDTLNSSVIHLKLDNHWYTNTRASKHMTFKKDLIVDS